jgi:hypothetical protein
VEAADARARAAQAEVAAAAAEAAATAEAVAVQAEEAARARRQEADRAKRDAEEAAQAQPTSSAPLAKAPAPLQPYPLPQLPHQPPYQAPQPTVAPQPETPLAWGVKVTDGLEKPLEAWQFFCLKAREGFLGAGIEWEDLSKEIQIQEVNWVETDWEKYWEEDPTNVGETETVEWETEVQE